MESYHERKSRRVEKIINAGHRNILIVKNLCGILIIFENGYQQELTG